MSQDEKIVPFKASRTKSNTSYAPNVNEYGEFEIDKEPPLSNRLSWVQRFFYTMVVLLIVLAVFLTTFYGM